MPTSLKTENSRITQPLSGTLKGKKDIVSFIVRIKNIKQKLKRKKLVQFSTVVVSRCAKITMCFCPQVDTRRQKSPNAFRNNMVIISSHL